MEFLIQAAEEYGPIVFICILCFWLMHQSQKKNIDALKEQHNNSVEILQRNFQESLNVIKEIYTEKKIRN